MKRAPIVIPTLLLTACVQAHTVHLAGAPQYAPIPPSEVRVFYTEEDIPGTFERIAVIYAQGSSSMTNQTQMIEEMRAEAAEVGGNGIVLTAIREPSAGAQVAGAVFGVGTNRQGEVLVVRFDPYGDTASSQSADEEAALEDTTAAGRRGGASTAQIALDMVSHQTNGALWLVANRPAADDIYIRIRWLGDRRLMLSDEEGAVTLQFGSAGGLRLSPVDVQRSEGECGDPRLCQELVEVRIDRADLDRFGVGPVRINLLGRETVTADLPLEGSRAVQGLGER